uniref:Uncharacterized protein n=1 Tax=Strongyloides papillosus TaxID=174720 RepID=A0A0N5BII8_STREA
MKNLMKKKDNEVYVNISRNFIIFNYEKKFSVIGHDNLCNYQKNSILTLNLQKRQEKDVKEESIGGDKTMFLSILLEKQKIF